MCVCIKLNEKGYDMKIEIAESLMLSWVKHVKCCQIATLNWKTSEYWKNADDGTLNMAPTLNDLIAEMKKAFPDADFLRQKPQQIIGQAELDVLGLNIVGNTVNNIYAVDSAFHTNGLQYNKNGKKDNIGRLTEKMLRSALVLYDVFKTKRGHIIFCTPKVMPADEPVLTARVEKIQNFMNANGFDFEFLFLHDYSFYTEIILPIQDKSHTVADTSELFMRSLQILNMFEKYNTNNAPNLISGTVTHRKVVHRQSNVGSDYNNNLVAFCFSCGHTGLYPLLNQGEALDTAAKKLQIKATTLKNLRDSFDAYNPDSGRKGWYQKTLTDLQQKILDAYKHRKHDAYTDAKKILGIK